MYVYSYYLYIVHVCTRGRYTCMYVYSYYLYIVHMMNLYTRSLSLPVKASLAVTWTLSQWAWLCQSGIQFCMYYQEQAPSSWPLAAYDIISELINGWKL